MGGVVPETTGLITEFCPYCKRPLASYEPDATKIEVLHPKASMVMTVSVPAGATHGSMGVPLPLSARCLRWRCRLRRWWADH